MPDINHPRIVVDMEQGVKANIDIADNVAMITLNRKGLAKKMCDMEKDNPNISYRKEIDAYVERFPKMKAQDILVKLTKEIQEKSKTKNFKDM